MSLELFDYEYINDYWYPKEFLDHQNQMVGQLVKQMSMQLSGSVFHLNDIEINDELLQSF